jgi:4-amino-4-deoxy-L-arabinose transferase-like glycosyltransferase
MKKKINSEYLILFGILILAIVFRIIRLRTAPDWFQDEGEFIRLADYLSKGNLDFLGIRNSLLLIGRPPLFMWILAGAFKLFGMDILVLRSLAITCSFFSIGISYLLARQALGKTAAYYTAFLLAIFPEYIFYNRLGFSYNWTSLWILIFIFGLWKYLITENQRWLVIACLAAGIAFASDYVGIICILALLLVISLTHPSQLWKMVIVLIPWVVSILPIFIIAPVDALHDLAYTFFWGSGGEGDIVFMLARMLAIYPGMIQREPWILLGIIGLFTLSDKRLLGIILVVVCGVFALFSFNRTLAAQYLLPVWPLVMIGLGSFLARSVTYFFTNVKSSLINLKISQRWVVNDTVRTFLGSVGSTILVFAFVFLPISWLVILSIKGFVIEPVDPSIAINEVLWEEGYIAPSDAQAIAQEISKNVKSEDFVIAPGVVYRMLQSNAAHPRTVVVYEHGGNILGVRDVNHDRFTVNCSLSNAKYAVVDNTWRYWSASMAPEISTMLDKVKKWPMVLERGSLQLYCNPAFCQ